MIPYLASYFTLASPDGCETEIFNGCRTKTNFYKPGRAAAGWEFEEIGVWSGYCNPFWDNFSGEDPWHDPYNPATEEVAGFVLDPPDGQGHGFYLEPSGSKRIREERNSFTPLEMYFTGSVVSCTSRGEAALVCWLDKVLGDCSAACEGWGGKVYSFYPCEDDYPDVFFADSGRGVLRTGYVVEPARPEKKCDPADSLLAEHSAPLPYFDTGCRTFRKIVYRGYEQLDGSLDECLGNRYKFCFDVYEHCWYSTELQLFSGNIVSDRCNYFTTNNFGICNPVQDVDSCSVTDGYVAGVSIGGDSADAESIDLVSAEGVYYRPDKVVVKSFLTPHFGSGDFRPVINISGGFVKNFRVSVWQALDNVPPPDTEEGWCYYRGLKPCFRLDVGKIDADECFLLDKFGDCYTVCASGQRRKSRLAEKTGENLNCPSRYWVTLEVSENYVDSDVCLDFAVSKVDKI